MNKVYIIVSKSVDVLIKTQRPDIDMMLFKSLEELSNYMDKKPIIADKLFLTRDIVEPTYTVAFNYLINLLQNPVLSINEIYYLTEVNSEEIETVEFYKDRFNLNLTLDEGRLDKEYITNYICGMSIDNRPVKKKVVYIQKAEEYIQDKQRKEKEDLSADYETDEDALKGVHYEDPADIPISTCKETCRQYTLTGLPSIERTVATFIFAQFLAFNGTTLLIERDFKYHTLTDIAKRSGIAYLDIPIKELYEDVDATLSKIKNAGNNLIIVTCDSKSNYNYDFICNLLIYNLNESISYFIHEKDINEVAYEDDYILVSANTVVDILTSVSNLPSNYKCCSKVMLLDTSSIHELSITDANAIKSMLMKILNVDELVLNIYNINSLKLGGDIYDLQMYMH